MSRSANVSRLKWISNVLATSNPTSPPQQIAGAANVSITVRQTPGSTGTLAGNVQVQVTDFGGGPGGDLSTGQQPLAGDWVNQGSSSPVSGGATIRISLPAQTGKYIRIVWADGGSTTANIDAAITCTQYSDD